MALLNGGSVGGVGPQKFDANMEELKTLIQDVDSDVTSLGENLTESMEQLDTNVGNHVDEMQQTLEDAIDKSPAGCAAPWLESISAASQEDGIKVTYKARFMQGHVNSTENWLFAQTKGVMVRYSPENYPMNRNEGTLAFVDEDLFTVDENGVVTAKTKTYTLVGLTTNTKYYISAFPYSTYNVYNETLNQNNGSNKNLNNTTFCAWVGTAATLTVTITQNENYKTLGEITATLTPTAGGDPLTQSRTGAGNVVFSNVTAGEYMLSFSASKYFVTPESQEITLTAGQPNTTTAQYVFDTNLNSYTWDEISKFSADGIMGTIVPYGSKKQVKVKRRDVVLNGLTESNIQEVNVNAIFVAKNFYGGQPHCVFFTDDYVFRTKVNGYSNATTSAREGWSFSRSGYNGVVHNYLEQKYTDIFPEISSRFKEVTVGTMEYGGAYENQQTQVSCHVFYPSTTEVGHYNNPNSGETTGPFPYFNSNSRRKLVSNVQWLTRSSTGRGSSTVYLIGVNTSGEQQYVTARFCQDNTYNYRPLCFCIG